VNRDVQDLLGGIEFAMNGRREVVLTLGGGAFSGIDLAWAFTFEDGSPNDSTPRM
jgi:hypothetical protein